MTHTSQSLKQQLGLVTALAVLMLVAQPMAADVSADPASAAKFTWTVNGSANASVQIGNVLYVGGSFSRVSPSALLGSFYGLSAITGQPASLLPVVDGEVAVIEPDGAGGYYIGGSFTRVGGFPRTALARIGSDGTIDPGFVPALENIPNAPFPSTAGITSIARDGGRLFIAGHFTSVGGASRSGLAAIDASSGAVTPWVAGRVGKKATVASGRLVVIADLGNLVVATGLNLTSGAII